MKSEIVRIAQTYYSKLWTILMHLKKYVEEYGSVTTDNKEKANLFNRFFLLMLLYAYTLNF